MRLDELLSQLGRQNTHHTNTHCFRYVVGPDEATQEANLALLYDFAYTKLYWGARLPRPFLGR